MREDGLEAMAVVSHGALIGTSEAIEPHTSMDTLLDAFDLSKLSRAPGRFDMAELENLNARIVHELDYADVRERLSAMNADGGEAFWNAVRGNLAKVGEAQGWHAIVLVTRPASWPTKTASSLRKPLACCRPSHGTRPPGRPGPTPPRTLQAAKARACSCRCGLHSPASHTVRNSLRCCR
jgi:hypothetical protein